MNAWHVRRPSARVEQVLGSWRPFRAERDLLTTIPGIGPMTAAAVISEIGASVTEYFPDAAHLASWAGICPGNHESAGKRRSGKPRHGNQHLQRGESLGLTEEEVAFYDALADNESARGVMQDDKLKLIARELSERIKTKASLDWTQRETVRADMRRTVRRLLAKYGYPPDAQETATLLVIRQAELMAEGVVAS